MTILEDLGQCLTAGAKFNIGSIDGKVGIRDSGECHPSSEGSRNAKIVNKEETAEIRQLIIGRSKASLNIQIRDSDE